MKEWESWHDKEDLPFDCPMCAEPLKVPWKWEGNYQEAWCCGMLFRAYPSKVNYGRQDGFTLYLRFENVSPIRITPFSAHQVITEFEK